MNDDKLKTFVFLAVIGLGLYLTFQWNRRPDLMKAPEKIAQGPLIDVKKIRTLDEIPCLKFDLELVQHVHPILKIFIDDREETVPANIGLGDDCEKIFHTHDTSGKIHLESQDRVAYTLQDFFTVWGEPLARRGYKLEMTINGASFDAAQNSLGDLVLKTKQAIVLKYKKN